MPPYIATRHIFSREHYACVAVTDPQAKPGGDFVRDTLQVHFRRHYTQMAMLARFEFASLLRFSSRLTSAVAEFQALSLNNAEFERDIERIRDQFLRFTHRYRFTQVSNQVQGREMYDRFRESLRLDTLYQEVAQELQSTFDHVSSKRERRQTDEAIRLTKVAEIFASIGLSIAALSTPQWPSVRCWLREMTDGADVACDETQVSAGDDLFWGVVMAVAVYVLIEIIARWTGRNGRPSE